MQTHDRIILAIIYSKSADFADVGTEVIENAIAQYEQQNQLPDNRRDRSP